ncbi:hypothetical protein BGZ76_007568 [Entomortierella beljakovae]|nr:hypothetical protein BGZ76_007568 [Entomortierella beljakovae]
MSDQPPSVPPVTSEASTASGTTQQPATTTTESNSSTEPTQTSSTTTTTTTTTKDDPSTTTTTTSPTTTISTTITVPSDTTTSTHYVTTISVVTISTVVPQTTVVSGRSTTIYSTEYSTTITPTVIPDTYYPFPSTYHGLRIWQTVLIVVALLALIFICSTICLIGWIRRRRKKEKENEAVVMPWDTPNSASVIVGSLRGGVGGGGGLGISTVATTPGAGGDFGGDRGNWPEYNKETGLYMTDGYSDGHYLSRETSTITSGVASSYQYPQYNQQPYGHFHHQEPQPYIQSQGEGIQEEYHYPASYRDDYVETRQPQSYPPPPLSNLTTSPTNIHSEISPTRDEHELLVQDLEISYSEGSASGSGVASHDFGTDMQIGVHEKNAMFEVHRKSPQALLTNHEATVDHNQEIKVGGESLSPALESHGKNTSKPPTPIIKQDGTELKAHNALTASTISSAAADDRGSWGSEDAPKVRRFLDRLRAGDELIE